MKIFNNMLVAVMVVVFMLGVAGMVIMRATTVVDLSTADNFAASEGSTISQAGFHDASEDFVLIPGLPMVGEPPANSDY